MMNSWYPTSIRTYSVPEQNGVSERKNIIVIETSRAMLMEKGLPKCFWAEVVSTEIYMLNRCPTKVMQIKTSIEAWNGRKPLAKHLKVFSHICYKHVSKEKRGKLYEKTKKRIFLGYSTQSRGYLSNKEARNQVSMKMLHIIGRQKKLKERLSTFSYCQAKILIKTKMKLLLQLKNQHKS